MVYMNIVDEQEPQTNPPLSNLCMCAPLCSEWSRTEFPSGQSEWPCYRNGTSVLGWSPRRPLRENKKEHSAPSDTIKEDDLSQSVQWTTGEALGVVLTGTAHATVEGVGRAAGLGEVVVDVSDSRGQSVAAGAGAWTARWGGMGAWREMMQQTHRWSRFRQRRSWWFPCAAVLTFPKVLHLDTLSHSLTAIWGV